MANVTYYIGAGASAGKRSEDGWIIEGLPVVNEITKRLDDIIHNFDQASFPSDFSRVDQFVGLKTREDWEKAKERMLANMKWLLEGCRQNATIDTFAKKLVLQDRTPEFEHLERLLAFYFIIEQILNIPDSRYDTFLANILQDKRQFPQNIKVLSWNYDSQFEIAYHEYDEAQKLCIGSKLSKEYQLFDILKINGSATFKGGSNIAKYRKQQMEKISKEWSMYDPFDNKVSDTYSLLLDEIVDLYKWYVREINPTEDNSTNLSFAFDYNKPSDVLYRRAKEIVEVTDVLVIIGYTFPFFNREIDRKVLEYLNPDVTIYIQDLHPERVKQSFQAVCPDIKDAKIHLLSDVDQFFLPPQL